MSPTLFHRNVSILTELILDFEKETSSQKWLTVEFSILYQTPLNTYQHLLHLSSSLIECKNVQVYFHVPETQKKLTLFP